MANSPHKRSSLTITYDGKAFTRPVEEENSLDIKWQDDILEDPLSIKGNVKEEDRTSLDIKWHNDILEDPLSIKDNVKEEEKNSLIIKCQDDIPKDPLSIKDNIKQEDINWHDDIPKEPLSMKDEGKYNIKSKTQLWTCDFPIKLHVGLVVG